MRKSKELETSGKKKIQNLIPQNNSRPQERKIKIPKEAQLMDFSMEENRDKKQGELMEEFILTEIEKIERELDDENSKGKLHQTKNNVFDNSPSENIDSIRRKEENDDVFKIPEQFYERDRFEEENDYTSKWSATLDEIELPTMFTT